MSDPARPGFRLPGRILHMKYPNSSSKGEDWGHLRSFYISTGLSRVWHSPPSSGALCCSRQAYLLFDLLEEGKPFQYLLFKNKWLCSSCLPVAKPDRNSNHVGCTRPCPFSPSVLPNSVLHRDADSCFARIVLSHNYHFLDFICACVVCVRVRAPVHVH